jgi:hypothetical protein
MRVGIAYNILSNGDMSQSSLSSSYVIPNSVRSLIEQAWGFSIQAVWTGSPVGTLSLQSSADGVNWDTIANSSQAINGAGHFTWNYTGAFFPYVQLVYSKTSGTGTLNATLSYKGF